MARGPARSAVLEGRTVRRRDALGAIALAAFVGAGDARADGPHPTSDELQVEVRGGAASEFSSRASLDDAPREVTDAAGLVEAMPGVHVRRLGAEDSFATLSIRGSSSSEVVIVLAGVPLTGGADPSLDLGSLPLWPGARARVYRTFAPAALGQGSLGGTLVLDPPRVGGPARTEVWDAVGSFGAARIRVADIRDVGDGARVATALSASRATDDFTFYDPGHSEFTTRQNNGHAAVNGFVSATLPVHWSGGAPGALTLTTLVQARKQGSPGTIDYPTPYTTLDSNREMSVVELTRGSEGGTVYGRVWGRRDDLRLTNTAPAGTTAREFEPAHTNDGIVALGAAAGWRGRIVRDVKLDARIDATSERFSPGTDLGEAEPPGATRDAAGAGADLGWSVSRRTELTASGRLDAWTDHATGSPSHGEARPTAHVGFETSIGPASLAAHAGAVARPPSFIELYGNQGAVVGNPGLQSESAWSIDAGGRLVARGPVRLSLELVGFATWADNLIVFVRDGVFDVKANNIGRARIFGAETDVRASALGFDLHAAYTAMLSFNDVECDDATTRCSPPPLPGRPANDLVGDLSYTLGPATVRYGVDFVSGLRANTSGGILVPARMLHGVGAHLDLPGLPGLRVGVDIRNLFDLRTAAYPGFEGPPTPYPIGDLYDYPLPGRSVLVTAKWSSAR